MIAATALGLAAALLFALSAFLQQRAAREAVDGDTHSLRESSGVKRLLGGLLRSRTWRVGWLTNLCGVGTQATALKVGSVATVQPLMATQLLFVLAMASGEQRRWPSVRDWLSAAAVCGGLVLVLTAYGTSPLTGAPHRHRVLLVMAGVVTLIVILRQVSRHTAPWRASLLIGVAAGLCHALNAVYLKLTVEDLYHGGVSAAVLDWPVYALAATALAGMLLGQIAFASGPLPPAVAAMSITNPVASFVLGILAFDTPAPRDPGVLAAIALSGVLIALGVVGLANASSTRRLYRASAHKNAATSSTSTGAPDGSDCTPIALRAGSPSGPRAAEIAADAPSATGDSS
jgi:drug/metabolite transporter (DMT)-like permease